MKMQAALKETGVQVSLVAELDGHVVGFVLGQVFYGEFGRPEPVAIIDSLGVLPDFQKKNVARALMHQLRMNLKGLKIETIQTQVDWNQFELMKFFAKYDFKPAQKICLECKL